MQVTNVLLKKAKSKIVMVILRSTASSHRIISFRERIAEKKEIIYFDPYVLMDCVYKEEKKLKGVKRPLEITKDAREATYGVIPKELLET